MEQGICPRFCLWSATTKPPGLIDFCTCWRDLRWSGDLLVPFLGFPANVNYSIT